jgi:uncharacterized protein with ParB-like and HNH nuclease domain
MDIPRPVTYTLADLLQWRDSESLEISPKFQRRPVWTPKQRSYFIDTILQEMPSPPIYLRNIYRKKKVIHEVIDGQQRLRAVLDFHDGKYAISSNLKASYKGKRYGKLTEDEQMLILKYKFNCETFEAITNEEVYQIFRRMNTYSSPLTKQELRHGNFFGYFSQTADELAIEHNKFWEVNRIFSSRRIARMAEVQLTAELLISQIDGLQDKTKSIDDFYEKLDDSFPAREQHKKHFKATIDTISEAIGDALRDSQFSRPALFYTLFGVVYHRLAGMPKAPFKTPKRPLTEPEIDKLAGAVGYLSDVAAAARIEQRVKVNPKPEDKSEPRIAIPNRLRQFANACLSQTDNIAPRQVRFEALYERAFD